MVHRTLALASSFWIVSHWRCAGVSRKPEPAWRSLMTLNLSMETEMTRLITKNAHTTMNTTKKSAMAIHAP
eukprot:365083-Chlamydomonas_euryale.AAC.44